MPCPGTGPFAPIIEEQFQLLGGTTPSGGARFSTREANLTTTSTRYDPRGIAQLRLTSCSNAH